MQSGKKLPEFSDCICADWYLAWGKLELSLLGTVLCLFSDSGKALATESSGTPAFDTLLTVEIGWVFFRADTMEKALWYLRDMFSGCLMGSLDRELAELVTGKKFILQFVISLLFCTPFFGVLREKLEKKGLGAVTDGVLVILFFLSVCEMMASGYNPFIYFRF